MRLKTTLPGVGRPQERPAQKRFRELDRQAREQVELTGLQRAQLEVDLYEARMAAIQSVHTEQSQSWDWMAVAMCLPPPPPHKLRWHEMGVQYRVIAEMKGFKPQQIEAAIDTARMEDERRHQLALNTYTEELSEREKMKVLARRILDGDSQAYTEVLNEFWPFGEISDLGASIHFTVHSPRLLECAIKINGVQAIPTEIKSLSQGSGRLNIQQMPPGRFQDLYENYICGCVLRVARETFGLLPAETLLITAFIDTFDSSTGRNMEIPVLSVATLREQVSRMQFEGLSPSETIEDLLHHGDPKPSRKMSGFEPIEPLTTAHLCELTAEYNRIRSLFDQARSLRQAIDTDLQTLAQ
jgi:hypothetical protein